MDKRSAKAGTSKPDDVWHHLSDLEPVHAFDNSNGVTAPEDEADDHTDSDNFDRAVRANVIQNLAGPNFF